MMENSAVRLVVEEGFVTTIHWPRPWMLAAVVTLLLAGCGGGGTSVMPPIDSGPTPPVDNAPTPGISLLTGGLGGFGHLDGKGIEARFVQPGRLAVDSLGDVWVEDFTSSVVRDASYFGSYAGLRTIDAAGVVKADTTNQQPTDPTFVLTSPRTRLLTDGYGNVYWQGWSPTYADNVSQPYSVLNPPVPAPDMPAYRAYGYCQTGGEPGYGLLGIDRRGAWYCLERLADYPIGGLVKRAAGQPAMTLALRGYTTDGENAVARFSSTTFSGSMIFEAGGNGYFVNTQYYASGPGFNSIRRITPQGAISTLLPAVSRPRDSYSDGASGSATANNPAELQIDGAGNLYFSDTVVDFGNTVSFYVFFIRKLTPSGAASTLAGPFPGISFDGGTRRVNFAVDAGGNIFYFEQSQLVRVAPDGAKSAFAGSVPQLGSQDGVGSQARFAHPLGVAADAAGNVYVADCGNHTVRKIDAGGNTITLAGKPGQSGSDDGVGAAARFICPRGIAADAFGNIYVTHGDSGQNAALRKVDTKSGSVMTIVTSRGLVATGVAVDATGKVYTNDIPNQALRVFDPQTQALSMLAQGAFPYLTNSFGSTGDFSGIAVDRQGNIYARNPNTGKISKVDPRGNVTSLPGAGGAAVFSDTAGLAVDAAGNLYVADTQRHIVGKIAADGTMTTVAGASDSYYVRPGALPGSLGTPVGIALRPGVSGAQLFVTDENSVLSIVLP